MPKYNIKVNRKSYQVDVAEDTPLLWVLRDHLGLVGTKYGCGIAVCGACMVHVDGIATNSCILAIADIGSSEITTIEGLSEKGDHPLQVAWNEVDVPQCGYCQAGQIMTAAALLKENPHPSDDEIDQTMHGNLCRCGAYHRIKKAIKLASTKL